MVMLQVDVFACHDAQKISNVLLSNSGTSICIGWTHFDSSAVVSPPPLQIGIYFHMLLVFLFKKPLGDHSGFESAHTKNPGRPPEPGIDGGNGTDQQTFPQHAGALAFEEGVARIGRARLRRPGHLEDAPPCTRNPKRSSFHLTTEFVWFFFKLLLLITIVSL